MVRRIEMCIDAQMLSAYLDGELKEPYRTQVEEHLAHCPACRKHLEDLKSVGDKMRESDYKAEVLERRKDEIFSVLDKKYFQNGRKVSFIRRRFEISMPTLVTAAAAVVFIFVGGFAFFGSSASQTADILPSYALPADSSNIRYVSNEATLDNFTLEEIIRYLDSKGYNVDISLKGLQPLETAEAVE